MNGYFWGSDDWAFSNKSFEILSNQIMNEIRLKSTPSIIISKAIYVKKKWK